LIFLTIGTHEPFDRLVRAVDGWCAMRGTGAQVFGQITEPKQGGWRPLHFEWVARLTPEEYDQRIAETRLIISHAGMGTILTALHHAKPIVVMPRRGHLRETRNDHQFTTVRMLGRRPGIYVAEDEMQLGSVLDEVLAKERAAVSASPISSRADSQFTDALRAFLSGQSVAQK
jgi:UDP-N-acetylglucosamine transferase subunit ALG13